MPCRPPHWKLLGLILAVSGLAGCSAYMPYAGPRVGAVEQVGHNKTLDGIQLVNVNYALAHEIKDRIEKPKLNHLQYFTNPNPQLYTVGPGDTLQVYIWEAPPAMLFATSTGSTGVGAGSGSIMTAIPAQMVGSNGEITVPFAGPIPCAGKTLDEIAAEIRTRLKNMAHDPQVVVHLVNNHAQSISVVGNVHKSTQVPLIPGGFGG
ncbi:polysaccharide biosynthesis/export family protein [Candidatus Igneacidithiobacillus taiwanensis]|uniref:polysaccharide biosynthesis/export family protein n=1 Tax=Candidatus Igneacidithiobacillus taiwanensis TaxID=1945924 RepID=UPI0028995548|nr:polysaccharide biosynthesis/export family protein [Candidatus Igneacidithiobacillus taiwanensis]